MVIGITSLAEFSYNNSYQSSINMAPFEALYGRRCRSPIDWFDAFEVRPWGTDLLRDSLEKVKSIQEKQRRKVGKRNMQIERLETCSSWRVNKSC